MAEWRVRVLLVSDLHFELAQFDWVLSRSREHDAVVIAGDLLDQSSEMAVAAQIPVLLGYLEHLAARTTVFVASGNHDLIRLDTAGEKAPTWLAQARDFGVVSDLQSAFLGDTLISVCPFWDGPVGRQRLAGWLAEESNRVRAGWCWVYHSPPSDMPVSWTGSRSFGDPDLAGWIDELHPELVLTGHVHQAPMVEGGSWIATRGPTTVINAGHEPGPIPNHVVVDLETRRADWWSYEGTDSQVLAVP